MAETVNTTDQEAPQSDAAFEKSARWSVYGSHWPSRHYVHLLRFNSMPLQPHLKRIIEGHETLSRHDAAELLQIILRGEATDLEIAALLSSLATRGESPAEIAGFVDTMRAAATPIPLSEAERSLLTDTCGTGADLSGTFNISTAAALVAAAAGATVAKHGNRRVTSQCGSADVLEALGIPIALSPAEGAAYLRKHRFAFFHAPSLHPAMKTVMPVRRALGIRTIFHLVGPLSNPAGASAQIVGVYAPHLVSKVAEAMILLNTRHAFVVHGETGEGGRAAATKEVPAATKEAPAATVE